MPNIISGDFGAMGGISSVQNFVINENRSTISYKASNTAGAMGRLSGVFGWNGNYKALGAVPQLMPRDLKVAQSFFLGPDNNTYDVTGMDGTVYTGDIRINQVVINWNWESGDPITHTVSFTGNSPLGRANDDSFLPDTSAVQLADVCPTKFEISAADGAAFHTLTDLESAALTLLANNTEYSNSSTNCTRRTIAGGIDFTLSCVRKSTTQNVPETSILEIESGKDYQLKLFIDATLFWQLKWAIMKDHTGITGDIEGDALVGFTKNFEMQAFNGGNTGEITFPSTTAWWPFP